MILGLLLAWAVILAGGWIGWQLLRQNGRLLLRLEELEKRLNEVEFGENEQPTSLPVGSEAPGFELADLADERRSLAHFRGQPLVVLFFNPECGYCRELVPKLAALRPQPAALPLGGGGGGEGRRGPGEGNPLILILTTGDAEMNRQFFSEHKLRCPVLLQNGGEVAKDYHANGTPSGYLVSAEGKIASELTMGAEALLALAEGKSEIRNPKSEADQSLLTSAATEGDGRADRFKERSLARSRIQRDGLKAGTRAPDFRLPRLNGHGDLSLSDLRGKRVLLLFSSPHCGPCNALAPELEKFHREHSNVEVVMISKGEPKENRAKVKEHGLTFPVVLQQQWEISRRYAMFATPIAYLINEHGTIARDVAVGSDSILNLIVLAAQSPEQVQETVSS
jgi:peroxiredoxin